MKFKYRHNMMILILALNYSGKWDILNATKNLINDGVDANAIDEQVFL